MFIVRRRVSRSEKWFRVIVFILLLPYAAFTMHWALNPKSPINNK